MTRFALCNLPSLTLLLVDAERRRQDRIGAAGDLDRAGAFLGPAGDRKNRTQSTIDHMGGL